MRWNLLTGACLAVAWLVIVPVDRGAAQSGDDMGQLRLDPRLAGGIERAARTGRSFAVVLGIVTDGEDPEQLARIKIKFPWLPRDESDEETYWARIVMPMSGSGRGSWYLPEVGDEVLVAFEHGDMRRPVIIGALWDGVTVPPGCDLPDRACSCAKHCDGDAME